MKRSIIEGKRNDEEGEAGGGIHILPGRDIRWPEYSPAVSKLVADGNIVFAITMWEPAASSARDDVGTDTEPYISGRRRLVYELAALFRSRRETASRRSTNNLTRGVHDL